MASETLVGVSNGALGTQPDPQRTYQVVVAATPTMGTGKDGKLPWSLPSDLKLFEDITMTTSDPAKKNAIIMGRKMWESIPLKHRPLTGRLSVFLTRSRSFDIATAENVLICGSTMSALELLASALYLSFYRDCVCFWWWPDLKCLCSTVIVIAATTSMLLDAMRSILLKLKQISIVTFILAISALQFQPWYLSTVVENGIHHRFTTYVRVRKSAVQDRTKTNGSMSDTNSDS